MEPTTTAPTTAETSRPELPSLDPGVHVLAVDPDRVGPLHALAVDHVLETSARPGTPAYWVDAGHAACTYDLARVAPSPRVLDRFQVARGFTAHQHHDVVRQVVRRADDDTPLLVAPAVDARYRDADCPAGVAEDLLAGTTRQIARVATRHGVPTVVTTVADSPGDDATGVTAEPVYEAADRVLRVEHTELGPRFVGDGVETLVYPVESRPDGDVLQTTLAYWRRVLERRVRGRETADAGRPAAVEGSPR